MSEVPNNPNPDPADPDWSVYALPEEGVADLTDRLTEFLPEQEGETLPLIVGQVLDDFIDQAGALPENLRDEDAHAMICQMQMAVTLAYQLGRLEAGSPDMVRRFILEAIQKWEAKPLPDSLDLSKRISASRKNWFCPASAAGGRRISAPKTTTGTRNRRRNLLAAPLPAILEGLFR